jgi:DNA-binding NtrC family response regulator
MIMPGMSGVEVFRALKKIDPKVRVVLISGYSFTDEAKKIRDEGALAFLEKPVAAQDLLSTISEATRGNRQSAP